MVRGRRQSSTVIYTVSSLLPALLVCLLYCIYIYIYIYIFNLDCYTTGLCTHSKFNLLFFRFPAFLPKKLVASLGPSLGFFIVTLTISL